MHKTSRLLALLIATACLPLTACEPVSVTAGVAAGALMIVDRRSSDTYVTDQAIELRSSSRISEQFGDRTHINITSYNRTVLITGEVPDANVKAEITRIVEGVPNVKSVVNEVQIGGITTLSARSNDTWLTSKVKARFVDADKFPAHLVKVVTEANTAYLLGLVTQREADAAKEIARTTGGVLRVVTVFEIISDKQAADMDRRTSQEKTGK